MNICKTLIAASFVSSTLFAMTTNAMVMDVSNNDASDSLSLDFTNDYWYGVQGQTSYNQDGITLASTGGKMTFNNSNSEANGCKASNPNAGLACNGDGIGISNDEITGKRNQTLTVTFDSLVNIIEIELLDLFSGEGDGGASEVAIINNEIFSNSQYVTGGYFATGYQANGITVIELTAGNDDWSDYSLARITATSVPEPGSIALLAMGLVGLGLARRRTA